MVNPMRFWEPELRALLDAGEWPVAAAACRVAFGADRLERSPEEIERLFRFLPGRLREEATALLHAEPVPRDQKGWEKVLDRVFDALNGDLIKVDPDKLLGGVSASGHVGSCAHRLSSALESRITYCVVSDRRLVFAERQVDSTFVELASVPRGAVLNARRAGRIFQRGRIVLDFVDLSRLALMTGIVFTGPATRLVCAINGGMVRDRD